MYRHILVPVDGSTTAARGLREAIKLARGQRARLTILHAIYVYIDDDMLQATAFSPQINEVSRRFGRRMLDRAAALAKRHGVRAATVLAERPGWNPADLIVAEAKKRKVDLIVLGTHGRRGVRRLVLGSDAEQVVRLAPVPVLLVRAKAPR